MDSTEGAVTPAQRHKARHFAMQAIYQWQLNYPQKLKALALK